MVDVYDLMDQFYFGLLLLKATPKGVFLPYILGDFGNRCRLCRHLGDVPVRGMLLTIILSKARMSLPDGRIKSLYYI